MGVVRLLGSARSRQENAQGISGTAATSMMHMAATDKVSLGGGVRGGAGVGCWAGWIGRSRAACMALVTRAVDCSDERTQALAQIVMMMAADGLLVRVSTVAPATVITVRYTADPKEVNSVKMSVKLSTNSVRSRISM